MTDSWLRFWDRPHRIYANDRHLRVHYARIADDIVSVLPDRRGLRVLDYGCGDALEAARVAARTGRLYLYDAAPSVRERLETRLSGVPNLTVLDDAGLAALPAGSLDVIIVFSVIQYIDRAVLPAVLGRLRQSLAQGGTLVLADVIPPEAGMIDDVRALLITAAPNGFLLAALWSLGLTFFSDYRRLRQNLGLAIYADDEIRDVLHRAGFAVERHSRNLGFHPARRTYIARPA
jgi:SAM-dependent methyltransferase